LFFNLFSPSYCFLTFFPLTFYVDFFFLNGFLFPFNLVLTPSVAFWATGYFVFPLSFKFDSDCRSLMGNDCRGVLAAFAFAFAFASRLV